MMKKPCGNTKLTKIILWRKDVLRTILIFLILAACVALYQHRSFAAEKCDTMEEGWYPPSVGPLITWTAPVCERGGLEAQPSFFYNRTRGAFDNEGHYKSFKDKETKSQYQEQLLLQYGLADRLEIAGQAVYQQNLQHQNGVSAEAAGFGDTCMFLRYCALDEKGWIPHVTGLFQLKIPTGKYQKADEGKLGTDLMGATSGGGSYDYGFGIILTKRLKPLIFHLDAIYSFPTRTKVDGVKTRYGTYVNYDFGAEYFLPKGFSLMLEFNGFLQGDRRDDGALVPASDTSYLNITPGIGWSCKKIQTLLAYQRTLAGENTDVNDSLIFTFVYAF